MATEKSRDIMTPDPTCCLTTDTVEQAAQIMRDENVGSVPVVSDKTNKGLLGIVTDRDLAIKVLAGGREARTTTVADVMTSDVVSVQPDDDINRAMQLMAQHQVRRIPVVDGNNNLVGIIAQADVATLVEQPGKVAAVVERISEPGSAPHM